MSLVSLSNAQARVGDAVTQDMIDEVEEHWTSVLGPLDGERTETFFLSNRRYPLRTVDGLYLTRRTDSVTLTNASTGESATTLTAGSDYRLFDHCLIERIATGATWLDELAATYEPNDEETVRSVIYDTLSYRQTPAGLQSVRIGAYSETFFPREGRVGDPVMNALVRRVLPAAGLGVTSPFRYATDRRDRTLIEVSGS